MSSNRTNTNFEKDLLALFGKFSKTLTASQGGRPDSQDTEIFSIYIFWSAILREMAEELTPLDKSESSSHSEIWTYINLREMLG